MHLRRQCTLSSFKALPLSQMLLSVCLQICIDLFITAQMYVDLATLRDLCYLTAGQLYHFSPFSPVNDSDQLANELRWNIIRPQVRCCISHAHFYQDEAQGWGCRAYLPARQAEAIFQCVDVGDAVRNFREKGLLQHRDVRQWGGCVP